MTDFELAEHAYRLARDTHGGTASTDEVLDTARKLLAFLKEHVPTKPAAE